MKNFEKMLRHLFLCAIKIKTGIYTVVISLLKELFCNLLMIQIMENRKRKVKWFCKFGNLKVQ
ncbi:hypothetical protein DMB65_11780 [Flavobacterium cheongpyeongense]|uniref:Uncharacterized protein n=1 Tax=Flavobacterium cheongpyeongense TaxID=2212651 RepID=A0A2V4BNK0_9FLAO|nr:hypothetical protein DMB65_11780 [Flavobacterium cheongpyeongense]